MLPDLQRGKAFGPDRALETQRNERATYLSLLQEPSYVFVLITPAHTLHNYSLLREVACLLTPKGLRSSFEAKIQKQCLKFGKILEALQLQEYIESCCAFSPV